MALRACKGMCGEQIGRVGVVGNVTVTCPGREPSVLRILDQQGLTGNCGIFHWRLRVVTQLWKWRFMGVFGKSAEEVRTVCAPPPKK